MKLSDCLLSEGESVDEVVACFACLQGAYNGLVEGDGIYTCADLKEIGFCDAVKNCAADKCNSVSSKRIKLELHTESVFFSQYWSVFSGIN